MRLVRTVLLLGVLALGAPGLAECQHYFSEYYGCSVCERIGGQTLGRWYEQVHYWVVCDGVVVYDTWETWASECGTC